MATKADCKKHYHHTKYIFLHCRKCDSEASANPDDYWDLSDDEVFKCCDEEMNLVEETTTREVLA
jgi:hypothetical protein